MKSKILSLSIVILSMFFFTSCVTTSRGFQSSPVISRNVDLDPIKADIKVDETKKLKGESTSSYFLFFRVKGDKTFADGINYSTDASAGIAQKLNPLRWIQSLRLNKVRGAAAYKALSAGNYDVLVHPTYQVTMKNYVLFKKYTVKVERYGGNYQNFRTEKQKIVVLQDGKEFIVQDK